MKLTEIKYTIELSREELQALKAVIESSNRSCMHKDVLVVVLEFSSILEGLCKQ